MRSTTWRMLCFAVVANLILSGCAEPEPPQPPTLAKDGGYVLTYKITDDNPDLTPNELEQRIAARIRGYCVIEDVKVKVEKDLVRIELPGSDQQRAERCQTSLSIPGHLSLNIVADKEHDDLLFTAAEASDDLVVKTPAGRTAIWTRCASDVHILPESTREIDGARYLLLIQQPGNIEGVHFDSFYLVPDTNGQPSLEFTATTEGARRLEHLTSSNIDRHLAIVFDHLIISAPTIRGKISERGIITGRFTEAELKKLLRTSKLATFGEIPPLELIEAEQIAPK